MSAGVSVIGIIADAVGIYGFLASLFTRQTANTCNVRVGAALNGGSGPSGGDGSLQMIRVYNDNEQILGSTGGGYIRTGEFQDFKISQANGQQAAFAILYGSTDAVCVPYVTTTWTDGQQFGWVGDWGKVCGLDWYYSNVYVDNSDKKPLCTWLDSDHTNGLKVSAIAIHFPSFSTRSTYSRTPKSYCGPKAFRAYRENDGSGALLGRGEVTRVPAKRTPDTRLVVSSDPSHSATGLCESETSRGPDLISTVEGLFCDMETRQVLKVCAGGVETDCVHMPSNSSVVVKRDGSTAEKGYTDVVLWD